MNFDFGFTSIWMVPFFVGTFCLYWLLPKKVRWIGLLLSSTIFYFLISWKSIFFLLFSCLSMWGCSLWIEKKNKEQKEYLASNPGLTLEEKKAYKKKNKKARRLILTLGILSNVLVLAVMKYTDFALSNVEAIGRIWNKDFEIRLPHFFLPVGISFYTFQAIGYLADVYWGKISPQRNFAKFALFLTYFPKILQGPIWRYAEADEALFGEHDFSYENMAHGFQRMLWGYFKKMLIADTLFVFINFAYGNVAALSGLEAFLAILFYFIQF